MSREIVGVTEDCVAIIAHTNVIRLAARQGMAFAQMGDGAKLREAVAAMVEASKALAEACETLDDTTDHLGDEVGA
ncbi:MAG: hypothetical protein JWP57_4372 [Spirosoma sp.]|nr:hypothetical protein [Spirosoma sp.]